MVYRRILIKATNSRFIFITRVSLTTMASPDPTILNALKTHLNKVVSSPPQDSEETKQLVEKLRKTLQIGLSSRKTKEGIDLTPKELVKWLRMFYLSLDDCQEKRKNFFTFLATNFGVDHTNINNECKQVFNIFKDVEKRGPETLLRSESRLRSSLRPLYSQFFSQLARMEGGLKTLIDIRGDLLTILRDSKHTTFNEGSLVPLQEFDTHLRETLSQWFSQGFLDLQRITWQTPCDIIEKVSDYEAVHSVRHWKDIKHRVGPYRRVFVFTHRTMPREPIVITHCALTSSPSNDVRELIKTTVDENEDPKKIKSAVFYSISAAHKGLSGIELGSSLINRVVQELRTKEFPFLEDFVTLSPIPGFRKWLESHLNQNIPNATQTCKISPDELQSLTRLYDNKNEHYLTTLQHALSTNTWATQREGALAKALKRPLLSLCARYLVNEKRRGVAFNPVTHFHIKNGASLWRLNWLADTSPHGLKQSYGLMVNYRYEPDIIDDNRVNNYLMKGEIKYSEEVSQYL